MIRTTLALTAMLGLMAALLPSASAQATPWLLLADASSIEFIYQAQGREDRGRFTRFDGDIVFDPVALDQSRVRFTVALGSLAGLAADRQRYLAAAAFFDSAAFPEATFTAEQFEALGDDRFAARGQLTIKGVSVPVAFPFSLEIDGNDADVVGDFAIDRTAFGIGSGQWADPDAIAHRVRVQVRVKARRQE